MADALINQVQDLFEGTIDFTGQKQTELLTTGILAVTGVISFFVGYVHENIHYTLWTGVLGALVAFLIVVPPWPFWNQKPEQWLRSTKSAGGVSIEVDGKKVN